MNVPQTVVELKSITKYFGEFCANDGIDFTLQKGEVHAILGENGAGKSTLMNILYGLLQPIDGEIYIYGKRVNVLSPRVAIQQGIGMVHQHFMLVKLFTVTENIILGSEITKFGVLKYGQAEQEIEALSRKYGLLVDPTSRIKDISIGIQQRVELLKVLYRGAKILILDEPTAVLTPQEIVELMKAIRGLVESGNSVILITHKLREIMEVANRCTVIRQGKLIDTVDVSSVSEQDLASMMVGHEVVFAPIPRKISKGKERLTIKNIFANDRKGFPMLRGIDLQLHGGEILALAGVEGNGQREFIEVLAGVRPFAKGKIYLEQQEIVNPNPQKMFEFGFGNIPEDRQKEGLVLEFNIAENIVLHSSKSFSKKFFLNQEKMHSVAMKLIKEFSIKPEDSYCKCKHMSGGNQQKVVISRELFAKPKVLIVAHPTRGLDVGATDYVHHCLCDQRDQGVAVLLVSFDLDEIFRLADRVAVIYEGHIIGIRDTEKTTRSEIGLLLAGQKHD